MTPWKFPRLVSDLPVAAAEQMPEATALVAGSKTISYAELVQLSHRVASGLIGLGLGRYDRVAIYLHKCDEHVLGMLGTAHAGGIFVPVNPVLKAPQVRHILEDSGARVLITSQGRLATLQADPAYLAALEHIVLIDGDINSQTANPTVSSWESLMQVSRSLTNANPIESDMAAILYTSGSTGKPKGVLLSHKNIVTGALSVADYLENSPDDRILAVLPLSFDAGMSQLTTGFVSGAQVVLLDYLLPKDVVKVCERHQITGITGVPPLWMQLTEQSWTTAATKHMRYFANTGGKMPRHTLTRLREIFPSAAPFLMYGLTEAFRSTYLPPSEVDRRPDSIGKAIPNAEVLVVRSDGTACAPGEPGELVHRGPLVSMGYWDDSDRTARRFKPAPGQPEGMPISELAVWSGDTVIADDEGYLYFVGRSDDMIKTSGYRVSPTEIEDAAFMTGLVAEAAAIGLPDERLGQRIVLIAKPCTQPGDYETLIKAFRETVPAYMVPAEVLFHEELPRNTNGKIDRKRLAAELYNGVEANYT